MAINYFIGWSVAQLEVELRAAQEDLAAGKATTRAGAGDAQVEDVVQKSAEDRIKMIYRALYALDPERYPIGQITAITSTKVAFS